MDPGFYHFLLDEYASSTFGNTRTQAWDTFEAILQSIDKSNKPESMQVAEDLLRQSRKVLDNLLGHVSRSTNAYYNIFNSRGLTFSRSSPLPALNAQRKLAGLPPLDVNAFVEPKRQTVSDPSDWKQQHNDEEEEIGNEHNEYDSEDEDEDDAPLLLAPDGIILICQYYAEVLYETHVKTRPLVLTTGSQNHMVTILVYPPLSDVHNVVICNSGDGLKYHHRSATGTSSQVIVDYTLSRVRVLHLLTHALLLEGVDAKQSRDLPITIRDLYRNILLPSRQSHLLTSTFPRAFFFPPQQSGSCTFYATYYLLRYLLTDKTTEDLQVRNKVFWQFRQAAFDFYLKEFRTAQRPPHAHGGSHQVLLHALRTKCHIILNPQVLIGARCMKQHELNVDEESRNFQLLLDETNRAIKSEQYLTDWVGNFGSFHSRMKTSTKHYQSHGDAMVSSATDKTIFHMMARKPMQYLERRYPEHTELAGTAWLEERWLWSLVRQEDSFFTPTADVIIAADVSTDDIITPLDLPLHLLHEGDNMSTVIGVLRLYCFLRVNEQLPDEHKYMRHGFDANVTHLKDLEALDTDEYLRFQQLFAVCSSADESLPNVGEWYKVLSLLARYHRYFPSHINFHQVWLRDFATTSKDQNLQSRPRLSEKLSNFRWLCSRDSDSESQDDEEGVNTWKQSDESIRSFVSHLIDSVNYRAESFALYQFFDFTKATLDASSLSDGGTIETNRMQTVLLPQQEIEWQESHSVIDFLSLVQQQDVIGLRGLLSPKWIQVHIGSDVALRWPCMNGKRDTAFICEEGGSLHGNVSDPDGLSTVRLYSDWFRRNADSLCQLLSPALSLENDQSTIFVTLYWLIHFAVPLTPKQVQHLLAFLYHLIGSDADGTNYEREQSFVRACDVKFETTAPETYRQCVLSFIVYCYLKKQQNDYEHQFQFISLVSEAHRETSHEWKGDRLWCTFLSSLAARQLLDVRRNIQSRLHALVVAWQRAQTGVDRRAWSTEGGATVSFHIDQAPSHARVTNVSSGSMVEVYFLGTGSYDPSISTLFKQYIFYRNMNDMTSASLLRLYGCPVQAGAFSGEGLHIELSSQADAAGYRRRVFSRLWLGERYLLFTPTSDASHQLIDSIAMTHPTLRTILGTGKVAVRLWGPEHDHVQVDLSRMNHVVEFFQLGIAFIVRVATSRAHDIVCVDLRTPNQTASRVVTSLDEGSIWTRWASNMGGCVFLLRPLTNTDNVADRSHRLVFFVPDTVQVPSGPFTVRTTPTKFYRQAAAEKGGEFHTLRVTRNGLHLDVNPVDVDALSGYVLLLLKYQRLDVLHQIYDVYLNLCQLPPYAWREDRYLASIHQFVKTADFGSPYRYFYQGGAGQRAKYYPLQYNRTAVAEDMHRLLHSSTYTHGFALTRQVEQTLRLSRVARTLQQPSSSRDDGASSLEIQAYRRQFQTCQSLSLDLMPPLSLRQKMRQEVLKRMRMHEDELCRVWHNNHTQPEFSWARMVMDASAAHPLYMILECDMLLRLLQDLEAFCGRVNGANDRHACQAFRDLIKTLDDGDFGYYRQARPLPVVLFETCFGGFIYAKQFELFEHIRNCLLQSVNESEWIRSFQLLMGKGKTTVITPLILIHMFLQRDAQKDMCLVLPEHLVRQSQALLASKYSAILPMVVITKLDVTREWQFASDFATIFGQRDRSRLFVTSDLSLKSLKLNLVEQTNCNDVEHRAVHAQARTYLRDGMYYLFDEVDSLMDPLTSELNYPARGQQLRIQEQTLIEAFILDFCLFLFDADKLQSHDTLGSARALVQIEVAHFASTIHTTLAKGKVQAPIYLAALQVYLTAAPVEASSVDPHQVFCVKRVLQTFIYSLTLIYAKDYGFGTTALDSQDVTAEKNTMVAIPYQSVDHPVNGSEFTDIVLTMILTTLSYLQIPRLRKRDQQVLAELLTVEYNKVGDVESLRHVSDNWNRVLYRYILPRSWGGVDWAALAKHVVSSKRQRASYVYILLTTHIHPAYMKVYQQQLNLSFLDVVCPSFSAHRVGFSGTVHVPVPRYIPLVVSDHVAPRHRHAGEWIMTDDISNGGIECALSGLYNPVTPVQIKTYHDVIEHLFAQWNNNRPYDVLIDAGAFFRDRSAVDVARLICRSIRSNGDHRRRVIFIDPHDQIMQLAASADDVPTPYAPQDLVPDAHSLFLYYDHRHTVGVDIKQPPAMHGFITVNSFNTYTQVAQAAFRMRNLNNGHSFDIGYFESLTEVSQELLSHAPRLETQSSSASSVSAKRQRTDATISASASTTTASIGTILQFLRLTEAAHFAQMQTQLHVQNLKLLRRYRTTSECLEVGDFTDPLFDERVTTPSIHATTQTVYNDWLQRQLCTSRESDVRFSDQISLLCHHLATANLVTLHSVQVALNEAQSTEVVQHINHAHVEAAPGFVLRVIAERSIHEYAHFFGSAHLTAPRKSFLTIANASPRPTVDPWVLRERARNAGIEDWQPPTADDVEKVLMGDTERIDFIRHVDQRWSRALGISMTGLFYQTWHQQATRLSDGDTRPPHDLFCLSHTRSEGVLLLTKIEVTALVLFLGTPEMQSHVGDYHLEDKFGNAGWLLPSHQHHSSHALRQNTGRTTWIRLLMGRQLRLDERATLFQLLASQPDYLGCLDDFLASLRHPNLFDATLGEEFLKDVRKPDAWASFQQRAAHPDGSIQRTCGVPKMSNDVFTRILSAFSQRRDTSNNNLPAARAATVQRDHSARASKRKRSNEEGTEIK